MRVTQKDTRQTQARQFAGTSSGGQGHNTRGCASATRGASESGPASARGGAHARPVQVVDSGEDSEDEEGEGKEDDGMYFFRTSGNAGIQGLERVVSLPS